MTLKRLIAILMAVLMIVALLAGCDSSGSKKTKKKNKDTTATSDTADPDGKEDDYQKDDKKDDDSDGQEDDDPDPVIGAPIDGTYYVSRYMGMDPEYMAEMGADYDGSTVDEFLESLDITSYEELVILTLNADGTAVFSLAGEEDETGTWERNENEVAITVSGETLTFTLDGDELSYTDEDGSESVFVKKDAPTPRPRPSLDPPAGDVSFVGRFVLKTIEGQPWEDMIDEMLEEEGISMEEFLEEMGVDSLEYFMAIELKADGTAIFSVEGEEDETGEWEADGSQVEITIDGSPMTFTLDGEDLFTEDDGSDYVFTKE